MNTPAEMTYKIYRSLAFILLTGGFAITKIWMGAAAAIAFAVFSLISTRYTASWLISGRLIGYLMIAVGGTLSGVSPFLLIPGVACSLACWEMEDFFSTAHRGSSISTYEKTHRKWLGITSAIGVSVGMVCLFVKIYLPFGVLVLIALMVLLSLFQLVKLFGQIQRRDMH